jgi:glucosamine-6-phosphate deaminase
MAEIVVVPTERDAGALVATAVWRLVDREPAPVLGVATGSTPLEVYRALARSRDGRDLTALMAFALDEYVGLGREHPQSYRQTLLREFAAPLGLGDHQVVVPDGDPLTLARAGERFERAIATAGGVDLQLLGIGTDGHVGFNEPGSSLASRTRVKTLTEQTRRDNARFFDSIDEVPIHCVTQGLGTIRDAGHLVLLAFGAAKAAAVAAAVEGPVSASSPGSIIQLHPRVTVVLDPPAAADLRHLDYYRRAWEQKPAWQGI